MRKTSIVLAFTFAILAIVFTVLPLGTLAFAPVALALIFSYVAFIKSDETQKKIPKWLLIVSALTLLAVIGKEFMVKDEVAKDVQFEQKKVESKKEDMKDLEDLEDLE